MTDHREVMMNLAKEKGWKTGIELGLGHGMLFRRFLDSGLEMMVGVDIGINPSWRIYLERIQKDYPDNCRIIFSSTKDAVNLVPDNSADFVFIDAGHSYIAAKYDIELWESKVKPGGWFGGHDYHESFPGVMRAVKEKYGKSFELLDGYIWARK